MFKTIRLLRVIAALSAVLALSLAAVPPAAAADLAETPAFSLEPAELLAAADAARPDDADEGFVLLYETRFTFDTAGRIRYLRRRVFQPLSQRMARVWNDTAMNWDPWHQERPEIRARVVTTDGTEHRLDPETLTDVSLQASEPDMFQDRHQYGGPLPAVAPGSVVEEVIEVVDREPLFAAGTVRRQFVSLAVPVVRSRVVLDAPEALPLHWKTALLPETEPEVQTSDGRVRTVFDLHGVAADEAVPPGLPPELPRFAYVGFATGASWNAVASAYSEIVDSRIGAGRPEGLPDLSETAGREERIAASVAWMHARVRYTGLELGDAAIVPRTPDEVLARRYGDCKDKATLLVALLRRLGVPARVALLKAGSGQDVDPELPGLTGLGGFDHAIVYVPGEPALWIDATDPFSPVGELPPGDQGRLALVASPESTELVATPRADAETNRVVVDHEIELVELGKARQVDVEVRRGASARELRIAWDVAADRIQEAAEEQGGSFEIEGIEDLAQPVRLRVVADEVDHAVSDLDQAVVAISAAPLLERLPDELRDPDGEPREQPYVVAEPLLVESSFHIVPPPGFALRDLPEGERRPLGCASYQVELERRGEEVFVRQRFELARHRLTAEEFDALRTAAAGLAGETAKLLWFDQVGSSHLHAGRVREALVEYRRLADLHPSEALHQVQLAKALVAGGLGAEARAAARRAAEIEPDSVLAHQTLGLILSSDLVGRRLTTGFDRDGARAAFERAAELDSDDLDAQVQLALVLEHAPDGTRYGRGPDLDRAIEIYRAVQDRLAGTGFENNLVFALLEAERYGELAEALGEQPETATRKTLLTIAEAMTEGPEQAIRKASERSRGNQDQLRETLVAAGQDRLARRYYSQAAELIAAGARSAPNAAELLKLAETSRHARRHEELRPDTGSPEGAVRATILTTAGPEPDLDAFATSLAPSVRPAVEELLRRDEGRAALTETLLQATATTGVENPDLALDLTLAAPYDLSGNDQGGYRVRLAPPGPQTPDGVYAFVVATEDGYRLAAVSSAPAMLGQEALARVQAGDVEGARRWLDWATELVAPAPVGQEPLSGGPLDLLWTRGSQAEAGDVRIAAAALAFAGGLSEDARDLLAAELETSTGRRRQGVALALAYGYQLEERWEEELAVADLLAEEVPRSQIAFLLGASALHGLERFADMSERARSRASRFPDEVMAQRVAAEAEWQAGDLEAARAAYRRIETDGRAESTDYNQLAWLSLFSDPMDENALRWAQRAAELDGYAESASLHTLAAVYADAERPADAYRVVLQAIEARSEPEPVPHDWYVFGRLAELYGLPEAAADYFRRVETPDDDRPGSTWRLAQRRLRALEPAAREASAPPKR